MPGPIVFHGAHDASLSLYLDGLGGAVDVHPPGDPARDMERLGRAGLVVHVRGFGRVVRSGLDAELARRGIPRAWFTDDDLTALRGDQPGFGFYGEDRVRRFAAGMAALIGTTPALCARLGAFHGRVLSWPCVLDPTLLPAPAPRRAGPPRLAVIGGGFRAPGLRDAVLPALDALPGHALFVAGELSRLVPQAARMAFQSDFRAFVAHWRALAPDIVLHPPGRSANLPMKGPGALLAALYLGAVPVVADEPAFAGLGPAQGVERVPGDAAAWRAALLRLADPSVREAYRDRLLRHATVAFAPSGAAAALDGLRALARPPSPPAPWRPRPGFVIRERLSALARRLGIPSR